jgi:hypothetical protein
MNPETRLILLCTRTYLEPEQITQLQTIVQGELDWEELLRLAKPHGLLSLLYWHFNEHCFGEVPEPVFDRLQKHFEDTARRNLYFWGDLIRVLKALGQAGIQAVPFKGPVLALTAYKNLSLRKFNDLDIWIHRQDFDEAREVLLAAGYQSWRSLTRKQEAACLKFNHEYTFLRPLGKLIVDLHWEITPPELRLRSYQEELWDKLETKTISRADILTFPPADLLLLLCLHGSKPVHGWARLNWLCDVAELLRVSPELDWDYLEDVIRELKVERMVYLGLYLVDDLLGVAIPEEIKQRVWGDTVVKALAQQVVPRLFSGLDQIPLPGAWESGLFYLKARGLLGESLRVTAHRMFIPSEEDWGECSLPLALYPLYRPVRLLGKFFSTGKKN